MMDINLTREAILRGHNLPNVDGQYTFYYDETNNVRKLYLTPDGMNIRRPDCFVLGGVVHRGAPRCIDLAELRALLRLQPSVKEIKLKHVGTGGFLNLLASERVACLLEWIDSQGMFIHYQVTDLLYWSIVDIVDSILTEIRQSSLYPAHLILKDALYSVLRDDVDGTAEFLARYNYPDVGRARRSEFINELLDLAESREHMLEHFSYKMLNGLLQAARKLRALPYLEDESPNVLLGGFGVFFLNRLSLFKHAHHVLDDERQIEAYLASLDLRDGEHPLRHFRFANSQSEAGIQLSDPIAGLLGKLFSYANRTPIETLMEDMAELTDRQRHSLSLLADQLDRSAEECPGFTQFVVSTENQRRAHFVLTAGLGRA